MNLIIFNKKITMILLAICLIIVSIVIYYHIYSLNHQSFDFSIMNEEYEVQLLINTPREAIEYAKDKDLFNLSKLEEIKETKEYLLSWKIFADKIDLN